MTSLGITPRKWGYQGKPEAGGGEGDMAMTESALVVPQWTLGDRLAKARRDQDITQEEMALRLSEKLGRTVSKQTVSNWESDTNRPRDLLEVIEAWSVITRCHRGWLLGVTATGYRSTSGRDASEYKRDHLSSIEGGGRLSRRRNPLLNAVETSSPL